MNVIKYGNINHNNQENWEVNESEHCTILTKHVSSVNEPYLVNIWKTMPLIPKALPKEWLVRLNDKVFINDQPCKPAVNPIIQEQNYRSLYREANRHFDHRWLDYGMQLRLSPWNGDYDNMTVSTREDPSYCNSCLAEHPRYHVYIDGLGHTFQKINDSVR